jgi:hypothetical protein
MKKTMLLLVISAVLLGACAPTPPTAAPSPTAALPSQTAASTATPALVLPTETPTPQATDDPTAKYAAFAESRDAAVAYLQSRLSRDNGIVYVYKDFADAVNTFTQKAKIDDGNSSYVADLNENYFESALTENSVIEARVTTRGNSWGGWLFLNGYLPKGETTPKLSFGEVPNAGMDLSGATDLIFQARGAQGGERVEFFTAGLGYDGETNQPMAAYPDSSTKRSLGFVTLTNEWTTYDIDVSQADLSSIGCGFGFVVSGTKSGDGETVFYLDDIHFVNVTSRAAGSPTFLRSYDTMPHIVPDQVYIQNAAFSYDNALAAMALLSAGQPDDARRILDAFVYAIQNDRYQPGRVRNAYVPGDVRPFPAWDSGARLPGWYDNDQKAYFEDQYQVGSNTGNTSYVALALLQYYRRNGGEEYLAAARDIMDWVIENCSDGNPGFTAGYDGWPEGGKSIVYTYKSTEHNIDAYAAFRQLSVITGEDQYRQAAASALKFIQSMYDPDQGYFYTGTGNDGLTPSKANVVLDAQVWTRLALGEETYAPYVQALDTALAMKTAEGGYPFHAANPNGGWWPEGTAFTALALREAGRDAEAIAALDALKGLQSDNGGFPAATVPALTTGFDLFTGAPWTYTDIPHIAPVAWYVMAVNGFNPYE